MLKELININSTTGSEAEIQKYILNLLTSFDLKPLQIKGNIAVIIKGVNTKNCLIFNAHIDTVNPGDIGLWKNDPFSGFEEGKKVYGVGASDNKSSVTVLLLLAQKFSNQKPDCDIIATFTVGEEVDGHGASETVKYLSSRYLKKYKNISAIVCEPTGLKNIGLAHKGNLFLKVTTKGKSGHGSEPISNTDHSVIKMYEVTRNLGKLSNKWKREYKNVILGFPTIGLVTSILSGSEAVPNKFPDSCSATFDIRTTPEMHNLAFKEIKKAIGKIGKVEYLYPPVSYGFTNKDSKISKVFQEVTKLKLVVFSGSSDMPFFTQIGIPTLIFGPGEASQMHKANEYCYSYKIDKCLDIFMRVIKGYNNTND